VIQALKEKTEKAIKLYENLVINVNSDYQDIKKEETENIIKPSFI
jgi:hypothetical protein